MAVHSPWLQRQGNLKETMAIQLCWGDAKEYCTKPPAEHCARAMSAFISCSLSSSLHIVSLRVTPCNSGLPSWVRLSRSSHGYRWARLDFQRCCSNSKDDDVLPGKRLDWR